MSGPEYDPEYDREADAIVVRIRQLSSRIDYERDPDAKAYALYHLKRVRNSLDVLLEPHEDVE